MFLTTAIKDFTPGLGKGYKVTVAIILFVLTCFSLQRQSTPAPSPVQIVVLSIV